MSIALIGHSLPLSLMFLGNCSVFLVKLSYFKKSWHATSHGHLYLEYTYNLTEAVVMSYTSVTSYTLSDERKCKSYSGGDFSTASHLWQYLLFYKQRHKVPQRRGCYIAESYKSH